MAKTSTARIPDQLLHDLGEYYNSDFVKEHMPWIRALTFEEFLQRHLREKEEAQRQALEGMGAA